MSPHLQAGFADPVTQSQAVFKAAMWALAEPAKALPAPVRLDAPRPLGPVAAALLLALADFETSIWLDPALAAVEDVAAYLRFHTGARVTEDPAAAQFAAIADTSAMPSFATFAQGTAEFPDRSTTLILQMDALAAGVPLVLEGPGIPGSREIAPAPLPADFPARLLANRARFPQGIDLLLVTDTEIAGLPRSLRVRSN